MRYISQFADLVLYRKNGSAAHQFENGVLTIGDATLNTAGNVIDAAQAAEATDIQQPYSTGSNLQKAGLDQTFFEAPPITPGAATVTLDKRYKVLSGAVTYNGVSYSPGENFTGVTGVTASSTSNGGIFALDIPYEFDKNLTGQFYNEHHKIKSTLHGDESSWKIGNNPVVTGNAYNWTRV